MQLLWWGYDNYRAREIRLLSPQRTSNQSYMKFGIYKSHTDRFSKQHKGNPPDRGDTILYCDAIAVGNTCADLNLEQEGYSCSSFEG